jgi:hypothetical protein
MYNETRVTAVAVLFVSSSWRWSTNASLNNHKFTSKKKSANSNIMQKRVGDEKVKTLV